MKILTTTPFPARLSVAGRDALLVKRLLEIAKEASYTHMDVDGETVPIDKLLEDIEAELKEEVIEV